MARPNHGNNFEIVVMRMIYVWVIQFRKLKFYNMFLFPIINDLKKKSLEHNIHQ